MVTGAGQGRPGPPYRPPIKSAPASTAAGSERPPAHLRASELAAAERLFMT